jgi:hypothetical protein
MARNQGSSTLPLGSATVENSPAVSPKVSYHLTSNYIPRHTAKRNKSICAHKSLCMNIHNSFIHNSQQWEQPNGTN